MRFLTADYLFPLHTAPIKKGVLVISDKGEIIAIHKNRADVPEDKLEVFEGILCPGFINVHCHLELSHLLGNAKKGKGFLEFAATIRQRDTFTKQQIEKAIESAEQQMINNGIVAVGDICNTSDTIKQKRKGNLQYYNFIEVFGVHEDKVETTFKHAKELKNKFRTSRQKATIVPHAPYSVPPFLTKKIYDSYDSQDLSVSIHMQETKEENQLFENKDGAFFHWLNTMNADTSIWESREKAIDILKELGDKKMILVHNTFTKQNDLTTAYYCTCPKANLYIENTLPDYSIFDANKLCVGTDSLASNDSLSILEELLIVQENSNFDLNTLLKIACKNGAEALGFSSLGRFEKGKTPGVNLIQNIDEMKLTKNSSVKPTSLL